MPRKGKKTEKPPLQFLERPVSVAKVQRHVPEVRAALNPKEFFSETQRENSSALNPWVIPQFDSSSSSSSLSSACLRRGRRKAGLVDSSTLLSRKTHKFPSLSFQARPGEPLHQTRTGIRTRTIDGAGSRPQASDWGKKSSTAAHEHKAPPSPKAAEDESCQSSPPFAHPLLQRPRSPPCTPPPEVLVADTPERDYGVKVTWRRRREMMLLLKDRGILSEANALVHS